MGSRKVNQDQLEGIEKGIASLEAEVVLLKVELDMTINSYWNSKGAGKAEGQEVCSFLLVYRTKGSYKVPGIHG
jgi:hypothetical protein